MDSHAAPRLAVRYEYAFFALHGKPDLCAAAQRDHDWAASDEKWGEAPCAFVTLHDGAAATADDIITFCREQLAHYKSPKTVVFGPLPKTSTGKIQKFVLRDEAENLEN